MNPRLRHGVWLAASIAILAGFSLRIMSFQWNNRLQGDVNLFALTAREFINQDRLFYPMKFEYSDHVEYRVLESPASQHPLLWPFAAGVLGKVFHSDDTFVLLKLMSLAVGAILLLLPVVMARPDWSEDKALAVACLALSPLLVDFSANGSSYILSALLILLTAVHLKNFRYERLTDYVQAGLISGIGLHIHSAMLSIPVSFILFWIFDRSKLKMKGIAIFIATILLLLSPWFLWNYHHFGKLFYSYSSYYFLKQLNVATVGVFDGIVTTRLTSGLTPATIKGYLSLVAADALTLLLYLAIVIGPFTFAMSVLGFQRLFQASRRKFLALVLPAATYGIISILWGSFKYRFLVPIIPIICISAGIGCSTLLMSVARRNTFWQVFAIICTAGTILWGVPRFFENPPTMYYPQDSSHASYYAEMLPMVDELGQLEPGVVLGYSNVLDGGFETIYWNRFPFVYGRGFDQEEVIQKLARDFNVRYIWTDQYTIERARSFFPQSEIILENEAFIVLRMP